MVARTTRNCGGKRESSGSRGGTTFASDVIYAELPASRAARCDFHAGRRHHRPSRQRSAAVPTVPSLITPLDCGMVGFSYAAGLGAR